ncbi:MAG: hypothetical protein AAGI53_16715 [Planctomycetota bacterium]
MTNKIAIAALVAFTGSAFAAAVNGGFEAGTGGDADNWEEFGGAMRTTTSPLAGNWSMELNAVGSDSAGAASGVTYNSIATGGLASLDELQTITMSFDAEANLGPGGVASGAFRLLDGSGAIVTQQILGISNGLNSYNFSLNVPAFGAAPSDAYAAFIEIVAQAGAFDGSTSFVRVDNVQINGALVPTPGAAAALGLGGLVAMRRRRA